MKILYNVTTNIDIAVEEEWKEWMINDHIPEVLKTGLFESYQMQKVISGEHTNGATYAVQYLAPSRIKYDQYINEHASRLRDIMQAKYPNKYGSFRTIMHVISQGTTI